MSVASDEASHASAMAVLVLVRISGPGEVFARQNLSSKIGVASVYTRVDYSDGDSSSFGRLPNLFCVIHRKRPLSISDLIC
jgi:hypothetical protein